MLDDRDNTVFGTYPGGVGWAAGRALVRAPTESVYAKLLDHRNVKDMGKTTLVTRLLERPPYLEFHQVDVAVRVRALFFWFKVEWTEAWAYSLVEGTREVPRKIVVSCEEIAGTRHIERQCGSYVLEARDHASTDLSLYDEIKAKRRSAAAADRTTRTEWLFTASHTARPASRPSARTAAGVTLARRDARRPRGGSGQVQSASACRLEPLELYQSVVEVPASAPAGDAI